MADKGDVTRGDKDDFPRCVSIVLYGDRTGVTGDQEFLNRYLPLPFCKMRGRYAVTQIERIELSPWYAHQIGDPWKAWISPSMGWRYAFHHIVHTTLDEAALSADCFVARYHSWFENHTGSNYGWACQGLTETDTIDMPGEGYLVPDDHILLSIGWLVPDAHVNYYNIVVKLWFKRTQIHSMQFEKLIGRVQL